MSASQRSLRAEPGPQPAITVCPSRLRRRQIAVPIPPIPPVTYAMRLTLEPMASPFSSVREPTGTDIIALFWNASTSTSAGSAAYVLPRRILAGGVAAHGERARWQSAALRVRGQPGLPGGPPGALVQRRALQPSLGVECGGGIVPGEQAMATLRVHRSAHDASVVAAAREQEGV